MKNFRYERAAGFGEAAERLKGADNTVVLAGGTDLLGKLKDEILPAYPDAVMDIKRIPKADKIKIEDGVMKIGALTTLKTVAESEEVGRAFPLLAQAAHSVASPLIRSSATIGGNLCQDVRCWFYRYPHEAAGRLDCARKCGEQCYAVQGENRYHSIFGGYKIKASECTMECPAGTDIPAYMALLRKGDWDGAAKTIMAVNPMPQITSRICPHPCQDQCNQCSHGDSVNIHCVERAVGDHIRENMDRFYVAPEKETGKKAAVIGAGPSGLSCAYYLRRLGHEVTVFDKMEKAGGVLMYGIPHYRLPKEILESYVQALEKMGVTFKLGVEVGKDIQTEEIEKAYDSVFIGTGAWKQPILGVHGEELTQFGLNFLVEVNTYLKKVAQFGDDVLVCGGGNVAMDVALTAVRLGAEHVTLVCLEQEEMPASKEEIARAREEGVKIVNGRGLSRVVDEDGKVVGLETKRCVSVFDEKGRFAPTYDEDDRTVIASDCILLATGQRVDLDFLGERLASQIRSERGLLHVDQETFKTAAPHVYGGGDAVTGPDIAIRAIRGGGAAARAMSRELGFEEERAAKEAQVLHYDKERVGIKVSHKAVELPAGERSLEREDSRSLTKEEAVEEAGRCMNCGCYAVSPSDIAPVLLALDGKIVTTERTLTAAEFCCSSPRVSDVLKKGELVKEIWLPLMDGAKTRYSKFRLRDAIDFAIVSVASVIKVEGGKIENARFVFGGVSPMPRQALELDAFLKGKAPSKEVAEEAAELAVKDAVPLQYNGYKIIELKALIKEAVLDL
ncbi:MAG: FAD-dependent oxidoreductase [Lachnospiraceae bacterium]|nr:FAD-dependent oxidoreductase [Lachnospiraceae bacterium]